MRLVAAIVAVLVLGEAGLAVHLFATRTAGHSVPVVAEASPKPSSSHPCNHGYYVSQAAHAKKGGKYVSGVAKSKLGKGGNCSAPLPPASGS